VPTGFVRFGFFWGSVPPRDAFGKIPSWERSHQHEDIRPVEPEDRGGTWFGISTVLRFGTYPTSGEPILIEDRLRR
jgi:hypothetical protein